MFSTTPSIPIRSCEFPPSKHEKGQKIKMPWVSFLLMCFLDIKLDEIEAVRDILFLREFDFTRTSKSVMPGAFRPQLRPVPVTSDLKVKTSEITG